MTQNRRDDRGESRRLAAAPTQPPGLPFMLAGGLAQASCDIGVANGIRLQPGDARQLLIINGVLELFHVRQAGMLECSARIKRQATDDAALPTRCVNCSSSHFAAGPGGVSLRQMPLKP